LITDFAAHVISFSTPTHTHHFGNHSYGYSHSKTALVRSFSRLLEIRFFDSLKVENGFGIDEDYGF
jgi:hypothetical protein